MKKEDEHKNYKYSSVSDKDMQSLNDNKTDSEECDCKKEKQNHKQSFPFSDDGNATKEVVVEEKDNSFKCADTEEGNKNYECTEEISLELENKRLADELLRMRAEMENSRKRLQRLFEEKAQEKSKALLLDIVELLDNFERALTAGDSSESNAKHSTNAIVEGVKMMEEQFLQTLSSKWGLKRYNSINCEFDPIFHDAMMKEHSDKVNKETVTEEFIKGYMFYEKVLRPAKVKVAIPKQEE